MRKYLFIFAMLLCWGHTTTAQKTDNLLNIAGLVPDISGETTYYLKNVGTGLYMSYGGEWGTHCIETQAAHPIIVEDKGDNLVAIGSLAGYLESNTLWMDSLKSKSNWKLVPVEGYSNQYYLVGDGDRVLTSVGNSAGLLNLQALSKKAMQRWIFTNGDDIRDNKMPKATKDCPFDVTVAIKGAAFDLVDGFSKTDKTPDKIANTSGLTPYYSKWQNYAANSKWIWHCGTRGWDPNEYNYCGITNGDRAAQTITYQMTLPKGTYHFSFEAFYTYMKVVTKQNQTRSGYSWKNDGDPWVDSYTDNGTLNATIKVNNQTFTLNKNTKLAYDDAAAAAIEFRDYDNYKHDGTFYLSGETTVSIVISKPQTTRTSTENGSSSNNKRVVTTTSYPGQVYFDDFTLFYYGPTEIADKDISHNAMFASYLNANFEELTAGFCQEAKEAFMENFVDISTIDTRPEYYEALSKFDAATEVAKTVQYTLVGVNIENPSFENGLTGWTCPVMYPDSWGDFGAYNTFPAEGMDGNHVFNYWCGYTVSWGWGAHTPISQEVKVPNGLYRLTALVASDDNRKVYVIGEDYYNGAQAVGAEKFVEVSTDFLVEDGTATIKACASNTDINFGTHYWPNGGWWYKADNFRMTRLNDLPHGRLKLAIDKAKTATFDANGQAMFSLTEYENLYNQAELNESEATNAVEGIYQMLQKAAKAQNTAGADMTWAIANHSFEKGNYNGWTLEGTGADVRAVPQSDPSLAALDADGRFLFNSWNNNGTTASIKQTIDGLPNGTYRLTVSVTSHAGWEVEVFANDETATVVADDVTRFKTVKVKFDVTDGAATIGVVGNRFYKADNFRLEYLADDHLILDEGASIGNINEPYKKITLKRTLKGNTWMTFVVPFDIPASFLEDWKVKELSGSTYDEVNDHITLTFADATDGIKAGVPYMVRNNSIDGSIPGFDMVDVHVNTTALNHKKVEHVTFKGVYNNGFVPAGAFFISGNTFYQAADETNKIKGYRAYIKINDNVPQSARSLTYRTDGETGITTEESTEEPTVVAIYNLQGVRLDDMQEGVNILQMSNGSTVKLIIK